MEILDTNIEIMLDITSHKMPTESGDRETLKLLLERQHSEKELHWSRNSYLLVVMSILILTFGQKSVENLFQLALFKIVISILGLALSSVWLLIQYRSS